MPDMYDRSFHWYTDLFQVIMRDSSPYAAALCVFIDKHWPTYYDDDAVTCECDLMETEDGVYTPQYPCLALTRTAEIYGIDPVIPTQ